MAAPIYPLLSPMLMAFGIPLLQRVLNIPIYCQAMPEMLAPATLVGEESSTRDSATLYCSPLAHPDCELPLHNTNTREIYQQIIMMMMMMMMMMIKYRLHHGMEVNTRFPQMRAEGVKVV